MYAGPQMERGALLMGKKTARYVGCELCGARMRELTLPRRQHYQKYTGKKNEGVGLPRCGGGGQDFPADTAVFFVFFVSLRPSGLLLYNTV